MTLLRCRSSLGMYILTSWVRSPAVNFYSLVDSSSNSSIGCRSGISTIGVPTILCFTSAANASIAWAALIS